MYSSLVLLIGLVLGRVNYSQHRVERFNVTNLKELSTLKEFIDSNQVDAWTQVKLGEVDLRLAPGQVGPEGLAHRVVIKDIQTSIDQESVKSRVGGFSSDYHSLDEIYAWLDSIGTNLTFSIGQSYEGRPIKGIRLGSDSAKFKLVAHGGIHAREWISTATIIHIIDSLKQQDLGPFQFHLIPVANPDGYEYSRDEDRMWSKNRQPIPGSKCIGTDNNRNWGFSWRKEGMPCSETYSGSSAFSSPESKSVSDYLLKVRPITYFDIHAYGQLFMSPYAYTCQKLNKDFPHQDAAAKLAVSAITAQSGRKYRQGGICKTIYQAYGSSVDWAYESTGIKYPYAIELPGENSFIVPPSQISSIGQESLAALLSIKDYILDHDQ